MSLFVIGFSLIKCPSISLPLLPSPLSSRTRLLDVISFEGRFENESIFYMVFEYMDKDLDHFIRQCPSPGMEESVIKVG